MADKKVWWILILINLSGIIAIYRTYKEIKNIDQKYKCPVFKTGHFLLSLGCFWGRHTSKFNAIFLQSLNVFS